jgi:pimeloyl-ACP methyl ester carboxylesterase
MYRHAFDRLPQRGLRTIAVDLRGFGLSDKPRHRGAYAIDAYRADLDALLDALGLDRVTLVGQSMGGGLALRYALMRPERVHRLVLINPSGLVPISYQRVARHAPHMVVDALGRRLVPRWVVGVILRHMAFGDPSHVTERVVDEYWAPTQLPGFVFAARSTLGEFDWRPLSSDDASRLAVPATVILGLQDRVIRDCKTAALAAGRLRGGRVHCLPGGHTVNEERPDEVYGIVAEDP